ncbi:MAG: transporter substrate-binding domain-containing protein [Coprococcus comes]
MDYSALTTSLAENKLDMGAAALCATDERKEVMDFSDIYCDSGQVVMVNKSNDDKGIKSVDDLKGQESSRRKRNSFSYVCNLRTLLSADAGST